MTTDNKLEAKEKPKGYAFWAIPGASAAVTYSLAVFHEIDFAVNEGFRKIPHGGIEEGGLLFGHIDAKGTRVEAFRPIQCEHASGPSFLLSERDLEVLTTQLKECSADPELQGLETVGWFLAHTRGPLLMTEREASLFDRFFAKPGMLTVLVKPERFQPTRFGFLVRGSDKSAMPRDAVASAVILPLPGRNTKESSVPIASIPAPAMSPEAVARRVPAAPPPPSQVSDSPHAEGAAELPVEQEPATRRRNARLTLDKVRAYEDPEETEEAPFAVTKRADLQPLPAAREAAALLPQQAERRELEALPDAYQQVELLSRRKKPGTAARLLLVLPLAALLGCVVGYIAYLQVPSPIIPLSVKAKGPTVIVSWPPEETRGAVYAAVRVDDSSPVMLTPEERAAGQVEVTLTPDLKVELISRNWIHDSRGVVRYIKPAAAAPPPAR